MVAPEVHSLLAAGVRVASAVTAPAKRSADDTAAIVFIDVAIVMVLARLAGVAARKLRQPAVVGEIIAGIALGPTILGWFPGHLTTKVFPTDIQPFLTILAEVGLIIFMFIVGMEVDLNLIRGKERVAGVISLSSIALPFGLGILLASAIHSSHVNAQASQAHRLLPFALFIGASMSITAFPVLARILTERKMYRTEIGALALACACVDDIVAWTLLALVLAVIKSSGALSLPRIIGESALFVAFQFLVTKRVLEWALKRYQKVGLTPSLFAVILCGLLLSAFATERIGIHQIFGAFLFGVVMPRKESAQLFHDVVGRLEEATLLLFLPMFFVITGLSVNLRTLGHDAFTQLPLILLVAVGGKLAGAFIAARVQKVPTEKAAALGVLMNTRGLTELIILNVGLSFKVLDTRLFSMLVLMAVITTIMTEPLLRLVYPEKALKKDIEEAERAALGIAEAYRVLALVEGGGDDTGLVDTAADLINGEHPAELVLSNFSRLRKGLELGSGLGQELGEMAAQIERLNGLKTRAEARGVHSVVRSLFTDDRGGDLLAQAAAVHADVLLVPLASGDDAVLAARLLKGADAEVVLVVEPGDQPGGGRSAGPVVAIVDEGINAAAALELATRVAFSRHLPLRLISRDGSRKTTRLAADRAEDLARAGLDVQAPARGGEDVADAVAATAPLLVVGAVASEGVAAGHPLAETAGTRVILVRASADDDGRGLERWLRRGDNAPA
ncbi:MAG: cation:proton antiporter [Acidimicrobiales bacterium]